MRCARRLCVRAAALYSEFERYFLLIVPTKRAQIDDEGDRRHQLRGRALEGPTVVAQGAIASDAMCVTQLHKVLARIWMFDPGVGEVLHPNRKFVLTTPADLAPDAKVISEIELSAKALMTCPVQRYNDIGAYAKFSEPVVCIAAGDL